MEELEGSRAYFNYKERCVFCDIIRQEKEQAVRVVHENREFIAITPSLPAFPLNLDSS